MAQNRKLYADFYSVECDGVDDFVPWLQRVGAMPNNTPAKTRSINGVDPVRLTRFLASTVDKDPVLEGIFTKIRMTGLPVKASSTSDKQEDIDFSDTEGVGESTAFLYVPARKILVLQRNRYGLTTHAFEEYFQHFAKRKRAVLLVPIISKHTLERLSAAKRLTKLTFKILPVASKDELKSGVSTLSYALDCMESAKAATLSVDLSVAPRSKNSLGHSAIIETIQTLLHLRKSLPCAREVRKLQVAIQETGNPTVAMLDLLRDKVSYSETVSYNTSRRLPDDAKLSFLEKAWKAQRDSIVFPE